MLSERAAPRPDRERARRKAGGHVREILLKATAADCESEDTSAPALEQGAEWNARVRRRGRDVRTIPHTTHGRVAFASSGRSLARARVRTGSRFTSEQNRSHNRTEQNAPSMGLRWTFDGPSMDLQRGFRRGLPRRTRGEFFPCVRCDVRCVVRVPRSRRTTVGVVFALLSPPQHRGPFPFACRLGRRGLGIGS
jgi:hypothetical protein